MAGQLPARGIGWPLCERHAVGDEGGGAAGLARAPAALGLPARQVVAPVIVVVAGDLGVDEAIDGLGADAGGPGALSGRRSARATSRWPVAPEPCAATQHRGRACCRSNGALWPSGRHRQVRSPPWRRCCASAPEPPTMARDPELQRFAGSSALRPINGQSRSAPQD